MEFPKTITTQSRRWCLRGVPDHPPSLSTTIAAGPKPGRRRTVRRWPSPTGCRRGRFPCQPASTRGPLRRCPGRGPRPCRTSRRLEGPRELAGLDVERDDRVVGPGGGAGVVLPGSRVDAAARGVDRGAGPDRGTRRGPEPGADLVRARLFRIVRNDAVVPTHVAASNLGGGDGVGGGAAFVAWIRRHDGFRQRKTPFRSFAGQDRASHAASASRARCRRVWSSSACVRPAVRIETRGASTSAFRPAAAG